MENRFSQKLELLFVFLPCLAKKDGKRTENRIILSVRFLYFLKEYGRVPPRYGYQSRDPEEAAP